MKLSSLLMRDMVAGAGGLLRTVLDTLVPPRCLGCGSITETPGSLCPHCWERITFLGDPSCACCGLPFENDPGAGALCAACLVRPPVYARARSVFRYDEASKGLVLGFKHGDRTASAPAFARWMVRAGTTLLADADLIVPVPLHRWRLFHRRYNQAALLANTIAALSGRPCCPDALLRRRATASQGTMGRAHRHRNVSGAFRLRRAGVAAGKRILMVDDVLTTGATVEECARVLLADGASAVDVVTLARVILR